MINFWLLEQRKPPTAKDIKQAAKKAANAPDAGDHGHVQAVLPIYGKGLPEIPQGSWDQAKLKTVKFKDLQATNAQLSRDNLIWHIQHPGMSRYKGKANTHPQVLKTAKGDFVVVDGHHRIAALKMLGLKKDAMWLLKEKDI